MAKKFIVKTTEEFVYDKEGRVIKKITTEESYEAETETLSVGDFVKKAVGVPNSGTITNPPYVTTVSYDTAISDANNTTNFNNLSNKAINDVANKVKMVLDREESLKKTTL